MSEAPLAVNPGQPIGTYSRISHHNTNFLETKENEPYFLSDNDIQLKLLLPRLQEIHSKYYASKSPDVRTIMPQMKESVLESTVLCFSSVFPLNQDPTKNDIWSMAVSFGAECTTELTRAVTHLVTQKKGTKKCLDASAIPGVQVVRLEWLLDCIFDWERKDETLYLLYPIAEGDKNAYFDELEVENPGFLLRIGADDWDEINKELEDLSDSDDSNATQESQESASGLPFSPGELDDFNLDDFENELSKELSGPTPKDSPEPTTKKRKLVE